MTPWERAKKNATIVADHEIMLGDVVTWDSRENFDYDCLWMIIGIADDQFYVMNMANHTMTVCHFNPNDRGLLFFRANQ